MRLLDTTDGLSYVMVEDWIFEKSTDQTTKPIVGSFIPEFST